MKNAIKGTEEPSVSFQLRNKELEESIRKTREALELQELKLGKASERLKDAGVNAENLGKASASLSEELRGAARRSAGQGERFHWGGPG